jgi:low affinity Fe/Cu permease
VEKFKLLFISFTITFLVLLTISPAIAKPLVSLTQLEVSNDINYKQTSRSTSVITKTTNIDVVNNYHNNFSTSLVFQSPRMLSEQPLNTTMDFFNTSTTFFTSIMVINDKLHQLISYFSKPNDTKTIENKTIEQGTKLIKEKCNSNLDFD